MNTPLIIIGIIVLAFIVGIIFKKTPVRLPYPGYEIGAIYWSPFGTFKFLGYSDERHALVFKPLTETSLMMMPIAYAGFPTNCLWTNPDEDIADSMVKT